MKILLLGLFFLGSPVFAHEHGHVQNTLTGYSVLWNSYEIGNHIAALLGFGHRTCCGSTTRAYHLIETLGHGTNLLEGVSHFIETNTPHLIAPVISLAFNTWAAQAQFSTLKARGYTRLGILLAPATVLDFIGHTSSGYVATQKLINFF